MDAMNKQSVGQKAQWYLVVGGETRGWKLRDCRAMHLEQAEQEADEALIDIRAKGDQTSIVRVVEATSGDVVYATTRREQPPVEVTCKRGGKHRWDEHRLHCLDCGREAAVIADELWDWLGQTEDARDRDADQLTEAHALLEWAEALILADNGDFSGWLSDYAAFAEKYPQEDEEEE